MNALAPWNMPAKLAALATSHAPRSALKLSASENCDAVARVAVSGQGGACGPLR